MPRKGENIYKRRDGRWEGRYIKARSSSGKALYGYVYSKSYREVKNKLVKAISENSSIIKSTSQIDNSLCFQDLVLEWCASRYPQIKESSKIKYQNLLNSYILPDLGEKPLNALTTDCIESHCNMLLCTGGQNGNGLSPKTVSDILSLFRNIFTYATNSGKGSFGNIASITIKQPQKEMRVLSRKEQEKLCDYLYNNLTPSNVGILFSLFTGVRVGEVCALRWSDISLSERTVHIHQTMQRIQTFNSPECKSRVIITTPKSSCSIRTIPLPDCLVNILSKCEHTPNGYLLTGGYTTFVEPRTMQNRFKRVLANCSIADANYHALRHTFATRCVELGFDIKSLSEILGHASVTITMNRYVHPSIELKRNNMERLSTLFAVK